MVFQLIPAVVKLPSVRLLSVQFEAPICESGNAVLRSFALATWTREILLRNVVRLKKQSPGRLSHLPVRNGSGR